MPRQSSLFAYDQPEDLRHELKTCSDGRLPADIWKTVSAFANTEGGEIILGVQPDGIPTGLTAEATDLIQRDILALCQNTLSYQVTPDIQLIGSVVIATIPPAPSAVRPVYSTSRGVTRGSYIRIGSSNVLVSDEVRNQFAVAARGGAELIEFPDYTATQVLDSTLIADYVAHINARRRDMYAGLDTDTILTKLRAIGRSGAPTLFGLLAFGQDDIAQEASAPTTNIAVTHYPGDSKVLEGDIERTHLDNREFNGTLIQQFTESFQFIKSKLPISGKVDPNGQRRDYLVIPEVALREALANAIAHRDYSTHSSRIQVDIFSDRVEIINPGTSLVPIEELESAPSVSRNPITMSFLKDLGYTEQRGRGIRTIRQSLRAAGLLEPEFTNVGSSFKATLYSSAFISKGDQLWLQRFKRHRLNERQLTALTHLKNDSGGLNNAEYRSINNMTSIGDDRRAKNDLAKLVDIGLIIAAGERRTRRYFINKDFLL